MKDRDRQIRRLVSGLKGQARQDTILALLTNPALTHIKIGTRVRMRQCRPSRTQRDNLIAIRLTDEEYLEVRRRARAEGVTQSTFARERMLA